jgi:hypothetical protein
VHSRPVGPDELPLVVHLVILCPVRRDGGCDQVVGNAERVHQLLPAGGQLLAQLPEGPIATEFSQYET